MKKIYILSTYTGTWFSRFLALFSSDKFVHMSISLDEDFTEVYSFGRKNPKRMFPAGFTKENLKLISTYYSDSLTRVYELDITEKQYDNLIKILKESFIDNASKYRYNIKGLPMINFNLRYHRKYHFVCSQFCGKLLSDAGIHEFNKDYSLIKPNDLISIEDLKLIYEGKIKDII